VAIRWIEARFDSKCKGCGEQMYEGDRIAYDYILMDRRYCYGDKFRYKKSEAEKFTKSNRFCKSYWCILLHSKSMGKRKGYTEFSRLKKIKDFCIANRFPFEIDTKVWKESK